MPRLAADAKDRLSALIRAIRGQARHSAFRQPHLVLGETVAARSAGMRADYAPHSAFERFPALSMVLSEFMSYGCPPSPFGFRILHSSFCLSPPTPSGR